MDLKLENILISASGKYKLGDLGFSKLMNKLSHDVPEGDARYLALELLNCDPSSPPPDLRKCDIFSLGVLAYELVERRRVQANGAEWHALREGRAQFSHPERHSPRLLRMVGLMLAPDPEQRPTTASLLGTFLLSRQERELRLCKRLIASLAAKLLRCSPALSQALPNPSE